MLPECLMNVCQRKCSMENYKLENAPMVVRRSDTRTPSKPPLKTSTYQQSHRNRLLRIVQNGEASQEWWIRSKKESAKPSRNVHSGKPELRHNQQIFHPQTSLVLSATGSLELRLVSSAILEHTNNNTSHSWLGLVIVSNDRRAYINRYFQIYPFTYIHTSRDWLYKSIQIYPGKAICSSLFVHLWFHGWSLRKKSIQIYWKIYHKKKKKSYKFFFHTLP